MFLQVQPTLLYPPMILESRTLSLLKNYKAETKVNAWYANAYTRECTEGEKKKPYYKKNENSVYIPNLKEGLNPNEDAGNSEYRACCRMERLNQPTY